MQGKHLNVSFYQCSPSTERDKTLGLATLYGGGGVWMATALERV